jgi:hypothetical protein
MQELLANYEILINANTKIINDMMISMISWNQWHAYIHKHTHIQIVKTNIQDEKRFLKSSKSVGKPNPTTSENYSLWWNGIHPRDTRMAKHTQINKQKPHQKNEEQKISSQYALKRHLIKSSIPFWKGLLIKLL